jgi:putative ABC transport system ATP-binding protein
METALIRSPEAGSPLIRLVDVTKAYPLPAGDVTAIDHLSLEVKRGEFVAMMGPSGSGKSTLLNLIGCLDVPTSGDLFLNGVKVRELSDDRLTELRRDTIGFVFQQFNLIPLGLEESLDTHRPSELSGGQQQRVAIARALVNDPDILLCDEPTGNLDTRTGTTIMELLARMNGAGKTIIMVTHDPRVAAYASRRIELEDGRIA